ncbi:hypothetical protein [Parasitella parasitica]|uniref:Uncharacterized protein n=1 Tax=Parasitella parasitica TaxID=35722 RepID=A0A0B7N1L9_9FUNG|nr:hypothetical protein [Parasitella parasitica]
MCDTSSYDKDTGYYRGTPISTVTVEAVSNSQQILRQDLVATPWDDDNFSLCLDTFPSSRLARTKYNQYPTTASPLRKHWGSCSSSSSSNCSSDHRIDEKDGIAPALIESPLPALSETKQKLAFSKSKKSESTPAHDRVSSRRDAAVAGGIFPYKNNANFLTRGDSEKKPSKINTRQRSNNKGRVEHISPLSSPSLILQDENDVFNRPRSLPRLPFAHKSSNTSIQSKFSGHSAMSLPTVSDTTHRPQHDHFRSSNESQFSESQYSESGESWKLVQRKCSSSAIVVMPSSMTPPIAHQQYQQHVALSRSHSSLRQQGHQATYAMIRSGSILCHDTYPEGGQSPLQYSNSIGSFGGFYTPPQGSPAPSIVSRSVNGSISSYRSLPVPRNADHLVLYSDDGLSSYYEASHAKNRDSTYSQVFDPAYNGRRKHRQPRKKVSVSIFAKLVKNLKQHFIKSASK